MRRVELLSPAKNVDVAIAAINNGADAVYIGGPAFGARKAVGNSLEDIEKAVCYAHRFYCRVFVTLNTILYDEELPEVERLIHSLYRCGCYYRAGPGHTEVGFATDSVARQHTDA